ncbi:GNAT family N-acetyltransferase/peptidase C39 family protein [Neptunomonas sp. CHC150]|uniref:GNAT family N-acetyltransferase/peptidase C39 family protein n=1 Tax=Neptunomonas TaxID=75687 RepID=UPI0025AED744|nr:GNAT family N-acetyltransferase/peptidase C39 family protein [Neptunomonas sp. CHC150]MDN2660634.1 GNAT family N-acetyltransferase/peptidase C39 family protein [Neptunomonas sp. CHC150]
MPNANLDTYTSVPPTLTIRQAAISDLDVLEQVENTCFLGDKLSRRRLKHWLQANNRIFLVVENNATIFGYGLVLLHKGTRLARLYSLAIMPTGRKTGAGQALLTALENNAAEKGRFFMRLEVSKNNTPAITLYRRLGYWCFDEYRDYYEDHSDALRMQKRILRGACAPNVRNTPWYQQTTEFTCGPASLLMAMATLQPERALTQLEELDIWREATTIFMTSGHGGCHPVGLALAAHYRGFVSAVYINTRTPLFIEGVRSDHKKHIMGVVDQHFKDQAHNAGLQVNYEDITQEQIQQALVRHATIIILISTYRMDGRKAPHWVVVTAMDDDCLYVHDPDPDDLSQDPLDCQHIPIARENFNHMACFGRERLRTAIIIENAAYSNNLS